MLEFVVGTMVLLAIGAVLAVLVSPSFALFCTALISIGVGDKK